MNDLAQIAKAARLYREKCAAYSAQERRVSVAVAYRDKIIAQRDRKDSQIPLRPHEKRYWDHKIEGAQRVVDEQTNTLSRMKK
jgi:hypothetical protein